MGLQTKTFTWGSYAYQSESNAYVLELSLTENSTNQADNTSNVSYSLVLKSGSNNRFTGQIDSTVKLNGVQVASGSKQITAAYNSSWTLLSGTTNVTHNQDGSLNMPIEVSINTYNSYAPPDKTLSWSWALTTIPRASSITSAANVELGNTCSVVWTPNSASFRYKLKFSVENWYYTTGVIHPNRTSAYTYNGYIIPIDVAEQITGSKTGTMKVELTTYSDSSGSTAIGSYSENFTVTVPENEDTKPTAAMSLVLVDDFDGLCLQGRTQLQGTLTASGKYGATIESLIMKVDGKNYGAPWLTKALTTTGQIPVVATAVDSRGFTETYELMVTVQPYYRPRFYGAAAYRCTSEGIQADDGEYLKIEATVDYAGVDGNNSAALFYRYRVEGAGAYSEDVEIAREITSREAVVSDALLNGTLDKSYAWSVQIVALDAVGEGTVTTVQIPCEAVFMHKPPGGKGLGLGGYCENGGLDVHWEIRGRKGINGLYMRKVEYNAGSDAFQLKTKYAINGATYTPRQTFFIFGMCNVTPVFGMLALSSTGTYTWTGNGNVTAAVAEDGMVNVTLPSARTNPLTVISADPFEIVE